MADRAVRREAGGNVIGICGSGEVSLVARIAGRRGVCVVVIGVALDTGESGVSSRQRIVGIRRVIECDGGPVARVVAGVARGRKCRGNVTGIRGPGEISLMAAIAGCGKGGVVVICMALGARNSRMGTGQRKHRSMIESGRSPGGGRVAESAIRWESRSYVSRIRGSGEVSLVAPVAGRGQGGVVVVYMTLRARHSDVCAGKGERGGVVIEGCPGPVRRRVTGGACGGEANSDVIRARRPGVIGFVARIAIGGHCCVVVICMALSARKSRMCARQRKHRSMIESGRSPGGGRVAESAIRWESRSYVSGIRGSGEVSLVAPVAGRG